MLESDLEDARRYAAGPNTAYEEHRAPKLMGRLVCEIERLQKQIQQLYAQLARKEGEP